jgi:hypothetical protein
MTNFNIEMVIKGEDSDELIEIHNEITMSAIGLPAKNWRKVYPQWNQDHISACCWLGNCYAMVVKALLNKEQPYPEDDKYIYSKRILPYTRFEITQVNDVDYNVKDWLTEFEILIPMYLLENSHFKVSGWYTQQQSQALGLKNTKQISEEIGYSLPEIARKLLEDGINSDYPNMDPNTDANLRFGMQGPDALKLYTIFDLDLKIDVYIHRSNLIKPEFDLVGWYREYVNENNISMTHYLSHSWHCESESFTAHPDECYYCSQPGDLTLCLIGNVYTTKIQNVLENCKPYLGDKILGAGFESSDEKHFSVYSDKNYFVMFDHSMDLKSRLHITWLYLADFSIARWYAQQCAKIHEFLCPADHVSQWMTKVESCPTEVGFIVEERIIEVLTCAMMFFNDPK